MFKFAWLYIILFFLAAFYLHGENVLLKDGSLIKGQLLNLNKNKISISVNSRVIDINIDQIEYLIAQVSQDKYSTIFIKRSNGTMMKVNLIKLTETALYYKNFNDDELRLLKFSSIAEISLEKTTIAKSMKENIYEAENDEINDINEDLNKIIEQLNKKNAADIARNTRNINPEMKPDEIQIDNADFYEKFWAKINKYIDINKENLLWNLLEDYSDKEKSLNMIYNEGLQEKSGNNNTGIKSKIIKLRSDFYKRAKKILLSR